MRWMGKKVLVTGAAGFIGQGVVKRLLADGAHVIAFDNFLYGKKDNIPTFVEEIVFGDVLNSEDLNKVKDADYVFHFGAPSSVILFNSDPIGCLNSTIFGFLNVLEWAKQKGARKVVYASSGSVYGNAPTPQGELTPPMPTNLYAMAKLTCEILAQRYSGQIPSVGLRIFAGYGPGEEHKGEFASVVTLFLDSILRDKSPVIYGNGTQKRDFIYIEDIVTSAIRTAELENLNWGIIDIGSGKAHSFNDLVCLINHLEGKEISATYVDKPMNYLENTLADVTKMRTLLGCTPLSLEDGLKEYLKHKEIQVQE